MHPLADQQRVLARHRHRHRDIRGLSTGLNLIYGYAGLLSFAQVAFFGLGGYCAALLVSRLGGSFWLALPAAAIVATLAGLLSVILPCVFRATPSRSSR